MNRVVESSRQNTAHLVPWTVDQYHAMIEAGILPEGAPIELIDGMLTYKDRRDDGGDIMIHGPKHAATIRKIVAVLQPLLDTREWSVQVQLPVVMPNLNEPEPDVCVLCGELARFNDRHPQPSDVALAVEVAKSSLSADRGKKRGLYAESGILAFLLVNLRDEVIELYTQPDPASKSYRACLVFRKGETVVVPLNSATTIRFPLDEVLS